MAKQCTASVLEALMGFDEQQSPHHAPRHSRVLSEGYLQRVASIGVPKKKSPSKCHPFRMPVEKPVELFSTLKVGDSFKSDSSCNELGDREKADSALSKHFSTDKMIQTSKDLQELPEVIDSMDISPRPTREKKYIFNHVENGLSVSKSHYTLTQGNNDAGTKFTDMKHGQACSSDNLDLLKSSMPFLEWRDKLCFSSSSPTSSKGSRLVSEKCKYFHGSQNGKHIAKEKERKTMVYAVEPIKQPSQVSRILDGSRRKTRHDFVNLNMKASRSESIYDDVHRKETEYRMISSPGLSNSKAEYKHTCCFSVEPYKAREPREKVIEEQKETEKLMLSRQGRKKNEMPILHHYATLPNDLNSKPVKYGLQKHVCSNKEHLHSGSPLCLSCKDERQDQLGKNSHRLRFCSAATVTTRSRTRSRYESLRNTWFLKSQGPATWLQCKASDKSSNGKDALDPTLKLSSKEFRIFPCPDSESDHIVNDGYMVEGDLKTRVEKKSLCDQQSLNSLSSRHNVFFCAQNNPVKRQNQAIGCSLKSDYQDDNFSGMASNVLAVKADDAEVPTVDKQEPDSMSCSLLETDGDSAPYSFRATCHSIQQEESIIFDKEGPGSEHYPGKELDSIVSLEEAYQPSPVSVLEPLFKEETLSSSESSGINSRDLMMQLELLMSDSLGTNSEGHEMFVSSDDDDGGGEGSKCSSEEIDNIMSTFKFKDSRDFSYLVDVLSEAGLHCKNLDKRCVSSNGQERHVISPSVFETLEKKFGEQTSWRRSERKLLFDRINSGLIELFQSFLGVPEWAKPVSRRFRPVLDREMIEEELWILLDSQEREVNKDLVDKQFGKEIGWIDLGDEIESICRELERLLITELVAEFGIIGFF